MKIKFKTKLAASLLGLGLSLSATAPADDTQIFMQNPLAQAGLPNVLFVWDNTANWEQPFIAEKTALINAFNGVDANKFNVGLMMFTESGGGNSNTDGAYVRAAIRLLDDNYKLKLSNLLNSLDILDDKSNGAKYSTASYEVWQYFNGLAPFAGNGKVKTDYTGNTSGTVQSQAIYALPNNALAGKSASPYRKPPSDGCQKNSVVFISNGPAADNTSDINSSRDGLIAAGGSDQAIPLSPSGEQTVLSDEWAKFMANHSLPDREKVSTYTIDVNPGFTGQGPAHSAMLKSMAQNNGGKYYCYGSATNALGDTCAASLDIVVDSIFQEILAVNSVFASVTLPVNVNVRGQYLNQVYMGLFRPDSTGKPLWPGNMKAYSVGQTGTTGTGAPIFGLTDKNNAGIENLDVTSTSYGFIKRNVTSYWSHTTSPGFWTTTYYPDAQGYAGAQDAPDGEMVEKGGGAQRLRDVYSKVSGSGIDINDTTTPRKLYTCVGVSGSTTTNCAQDNSLSTYPFLAGNLNDTVLGLAKSATVTGLARNNAGLVTVNATGQPFVAGETVTISGALAYTQASPSTQTDQNIYNGAQTIVSATANSFSFNVPVEPYSPAGGTILVAGSGSAPVNISGISRSDVDATTATVTTASAHGLANGTSITIAGSSGGFGGTYTISGASGSTFTIPVTPLPAPGSSLGGNGGSIVFYDATCSTIVTSRNIANNGISRTTGSTTVDITTGGSNLPNPIGAARVQITGLTPANYNVSCSENVGFSRQGNKLVRISLPLNLTHFSHEMTASGGTVSSSAAGASVAVTSLTRNGTVATASTAPNALPAGVTLGQSVVISGANQTAYNGTFTVTGVSGQSFTYTVPLYPSTPASGTIAANSSPGVNRTDMVNWVRGINVKGDDNANPNTDPAVVKSDVRGYLHGDVLHSRPVVLNYNRTGQPVGRDVVVFYGANDGFLHAVKGGLDATDGSELWGFIAPEHFSQLVRLYTGAPVVGFNSPKPYFFDGPISMLAKYNSVGATGSEEDRMEGTGAEALLFAGMRRGGRALYSLDVTTPDNPKFKWKVGPSTDGFSELGQTWSEAKVAKIKNCTKSGSTTTCSGDRDVLIFGAGYDPSAEDQWPQGMASMGRGVYIVDAHTGALLWMTGSAQPANYPTTNAPPFVQVSGMTYPIAADTAIIDRNGDGYIDRIYAADTGGNVWRINIDPTLDPVDWTGNVYKVASLRTASAASGSNNYRKFLYQMDVVFGDSYDSLLIGSGNRERPFDMSTEDRFYMLKDSSEINATPTTITEDTANNILCDVTDNVVPIDVSCAADSTDAGCLARATANACLADAGNKGWFFRLCSGEKVVNTALTLAGAVTFGTNVPYGSSCLPAPAVNQCTPNTGEGRLYMVDLKTGAPMSNADGLSSFTGADRYVKVGGGFPPSATQIVTKVCDPSGGNCQITNIVCSGSHCLQPPSTEIGRRYRIFWHMDADKN
jgi:type IV pilus assembly protein PilY1